MKRKATHLSSLAAAKKLSFGTRKVTKVARRWRNKGISAKPLISRFAQHPFPAEWKTKITWDASQVYMGPGATSAAYVVRLNDLYDPDYSNNFGNNQPLFTDQMISATGPYQRFRVNGWKVKLTIDNVSGNTTAGVPMPLDVYLCQGANNAVDVDTFSELQSSPGTITDTVGPAGSCADRKVFYINGRTSAYVPPGTDKDNEYCGDYSASPSKCLFLGIGIKCGDVLEGTQTPKAFMKIQIEYDVTFFARDGVAS